MIILKKIVNVKLSPEPTILDKLGIGIVVLLAQYFFEEKTPVSQFQKYWCKFSFYPRKFDSAWMMGLKIFAHIWL